MAEGGFDNPVYDDRIEEEETNVDEENYEDTVQEQEAQYEDEARRQTTEMLRSTVVEDAINSYYDKLKEMGYGEPLYDPLDFTLVDGKLTLRRYPDVRLVNEKNGIPLSLSTLRSRYGADVIRKGLGFSDYGLKNLNLKKNKYYLEF